MGARKTVSVDAVREIANNMLRNSNDDKAESREAIAILIEHVLMDTGNYHGFRYLDAEGDESRRYYL